MYRKYPTPFISGCLVVQTAIRYYYNIVMEYIKSADHTRIFTITELTTAIKDLLEGSFGPLTLKGEISNYRPSSTGHLYFTLKDENAAISAVMFKNNIRSLAFTPKDGILVQATGRLSVYPQRGSYQIIIETMSIAGEGAILQMLEERKRRLAAEGLFNTERKKTLPPFPHTIGVITSPTGAALRDILQITRRRSRNISVVILPCAVQGEHAGKGIAAMLRAANKYDIADVLIVGRGGGSLEDLLPFSDESVVRAIAESNIPVVSAVGHEIDWALSDFAADIRAPTPSAAAELVTPLQEQLQDDIHGMADVLYRTIRSKIDAVRTQLKLFAPESLELRFRSIEQPRLLRFDSAKEELFSAMQQKIQQLHQRTENAKRDLQASNPKTILQRGYAVVTNAQTGCVIRSWQDVHTGSTITIQPATGIITGTVTAAISDNRENQT